MNLEKPVKKDRAIIRSYSGTKTYKDWTLFVSDDLGIFASSKNHDLRKKYSGAVMDEFSNMHYSTTIFFPEILFIATVINKLSSDWNLKINNGSYTGSYSNDADCQIHKRTICFMKMQLSYINFFSNSVLSCYEENAGTDALNEVYNLIGSNPMFTEKFIVQYVSEINYWHLQQKQEDRMGCIIELMKSIITDDEGAKEFKNRSLVALNKSSDLGIWKEIPPPISRHLGLLKDGFV